MMGRVQARPLLIVGNPEIFHVGAHLLAAATTLGLSASLCDVRTAFTAPRVIRHVNWWLRGRLPTRLNAFSRQVLDTCREVRPQWLLCTGIAPVTRSALSEIGNLGIQRINFLTDDPWNPAHKAQWFLEALASYDIIFSPRLSNLDDLRRLGGPTVAYLPFAYAPATQFPEPPTAEEEPQFAFDVVFIGSADRDRLPHVAALIRAGVKLGLYGSIWERYRWTRPYAQGFAGPALQRKIIGGAKVVLCLTRRSNRDGHTMRTFEVPAIAGCMLTEDTDEHRRIFGDDGRVVVYFRTIPEMVVRLRWLMEHDGERRRLAAAAHRLIVEGANTYADRLRTMLEMQHNASLISTG